MNHLQVTSKFALFDQTCLLEWSFNSASACLLVPLAHIPKYGWDGGEKLWCHEEPSFLLPAAAYSNTDRVSRLGIMLLNS